MKTRIMNACILTMNDQLTVYDPGFIEFIDDKIVAVGSMSDCSSSIEATIIDAKGAIVMPGMVNAHTHVGMIPFRTLGDDMTDRLTRFLFPLEKACMTESLAYYSARYAIAEMQLAGVTTFVDQYYYEDQIAEAVDELQGRAILAETVLNETIDSSIPYGGLTYAKSFLPKWQGHPRIIPAIGPHAPYTNTNESLQEARDIADTYRVPLTIHASEMTFEMEQFQTSHGLTPIGYLDETGILNDRTLLAHCIFATEEDIQRMKKNNVAVAHCIGANTKSAKGVAPLRAMLDAGIRVGLGTDGPSSGNTLDLFTQMRLVALFHKTTLGDRTAFPAQEIVRLATIDGARAIGLEETIGSLEVGKQADVVLLEHDALSLFPSFDPYAVLVYATQAANVRSVWIAGVSVVSNKNLQFTSRQALRTELEHAMLPFIAEVHRIRNAK